MDISGDKDLIDEEPKFNSPQRKTSPIENLITNNKSNPNASDQQYEELCQKLNQFKIKIDAEIDAIECIDLAINVVTYSMYKIQNTYNMDLDLVRDEKKNVLLTNLTTSEISIQMGSLQDKFAEIQTSLDAELFAFDQQKNELQEQLESKTAELDLIFEDMEISVEVLRNKVQTDLRNFRQSFVDLVKDQYEPKVTEFGDCIDRYRGLQLTGWKLITSEILLANLLEERGIKVTKSGLLLTKGGDLLTYEEAIEKNLFSDIDFPTDKILPYLHRLSIQQDMKSSVDSDETSNASSDAKMSSEDVNYLKDVVGQPLTLALTEIMAIQPRDPIHYLAHWLFKYRYNRDLDAAQKIEFDELNTERDRLQQERWHRFVEDEARNVLLEIIMKIHSSIDGLGLIIEGDDEEEEEGNNDLSNLDYLNVLPPI